MSCLNMKNNGADMFIPDFYDGRSIFITGATGFLGKAIIEKLLRSCPNIAEIYLLMRPKKGLDINKRLKEMLDNKLFDRLRNEQPSSFDKLIPIAGDVSAEDLGLRPIDRQTLIEKVSIVFHVAANVRFNNNLRTVIFNNTRSTRDVCILAQDMKKLVALVHVSSTYTQFDKVVVDEIVYPFEIDWKQMIKIAESVDDYVLDIFTAKCLGSIPNTYIFSKKLAEQVISDYSKSLPCVIIRPSVVVPSMTEPIEGWLDNFNGPIGMLIGGGKGILRVCYTDPLVNCDYMPVDMFVKVAIIVAWIRGIKSITKDNTIHVYNCSQYDIICMTVKELVRMSFNTTKRIPLEGIIWSPHMTLTKNYSTFYIMVMLLHVLPALFIDGIMKLLNMRPMLLRLQRKIYITNNILSYFLLNTWQFHNEKMLGLFDNLSVDNQKDFGFDYRTVDTYSYFENIIIGAKTLLLHEDMNNLQAAKFHHKRMDWLDKIVQTLFTLIILWIVYRSNMVSYITEICSSLFA